ncbi:MAG TPA: hypothetical protein VGN59_00555 [Acidimicrobiia bacterium]
MKPLGAALRTIEAQAVEQLGVFSRAQAIELGVTRHAIAHRVKTGAWPLVLAGVHRVAVIRPSSAQLAMAATLWSSPDGLVSHATAAQLWGLEGIVSDRVHLTVPTGRSLRSTVVMVHHTGDLLPADVGRVGPIAVTSPLRTAIDLAGVVDAETLEIAIESALRRRLFSVGQLRWRATLLAGTGRRGSTALRHLIARRDLGRSDSRWELRAAQLLERAGLGTPVRQHPIRANGREIARADLAYPERRIVVEYDSDRWHTGVDRRHRDAARRNRLRALGWIVVEVTPAQLRDPAGLIAVVEAVLAAQVGGPARKNSRRWSSS